MAKKNPTLFNVRLHEDEDGVHIDLSGAFAKDFQTLLDSCRRICGSLCGCGSRVKDTDS